MAQDVAFEGWNVKHKWPCESMMHCWLLIVDCWSHPISDLLIDECSATPLLTTSVLGCFFSLVRLASISWTSLTDFFSFNVNYNSGQWGQSQSQQWSTKLAMVRFSLDSGGFTWTHTCTYGFGAANLFTCTLRFRFAKVRFGVKTNFSTQQYIYAIESPSSQNQGQSSSMHHLLQRAAHSNKYYKE